MIPSPIFRNPSESDAEREQRIEAQLGTNTTRSRLIVGGGILALIAFALCAANGLPGAGVILVPIGMGMLLGGGIELFLGGLGG